MLTNILLGLLLLGGSVLGAVLRREWRGAQDVARAQNELLAVDRHRPDTTDEVSRLDRAVASNYTEIQELRAAQANLTLAVDEGIRHVARAEKRVARTIHVVNKKLEESGLEHPGLEAEADELRELDGDGSDGGRMQLLPDEVEPAEEETPVDTGIPGYSV